MKFKENVFKKTLMLLVTLMIVMTSGCFSKKDEQPEQKIEIAEKTLNIKVVKNENSTTIMAQGNFLSATITLDGTIGDTDIETNAEVYKIVYFKDDKTYITVAKKDMEFKTDDEIVKIANLKANTGINLVSSIKKSDMNTTISAIKKVGEVTHTLLGDIDKD